MEDELGISIVGFVLFVLICLWGIFAGVDKVTLIIIGVLFVVIFTMLVFIMMRFFRKKTKLIRWFAIFFSVCISLAVIISIMAIWIVIVRYT